MKAYLAIKFHPDHSNRQLIEDLYNSFSSAEISIRVMARDIEGFGNIKFQPKELMEKAFEEIDSADALFVEISEKGVGLGIEAGYAFSKGKPIFVLAREGSDISETMQGIAQKTITYSNSQDLTAKLKEI